jgi:hypothetical protein
MKIAKYLPRQQVKYYRSWRKAVGCHSPRGEYNRNAFSSYLYNELGMSADERKNSRLPCGYTVAQSWAALRKSWLGFSIAHSNGDFSRMTRYAGIIRKVQREMGIQLTNFQSDILDEEDLVDEASNDDMEKVERDLDTQESDIDYEGIMDGAYEQLNVKVKPAIVPREQTFAVAKQRSEKSCKYVRPEKEQQTESRSWYDRQTGEVYDYPEEEDEDEVKEVENERETMHRSCFYKRTRYEQGLS